MAELGFGVAFNESSVLFPAKNCAICQHPWQKPGAWHRAQVLPYWQPGGIQ
jgi:hypothetical protein